MVFDSLEELKSYVMNKSSMAMNDCAEEMVDILRDEIKNQVKGWEGYLEKAPKVVSTSEDHAEVEVADNQGWTSLVTGENFENAMYGLEGGYTWNREKSNIMERSEEIAEREIPNEYKRLMNGLGVPMK